MHEHRPNAFSTSTSVLFLCSIFALTQEVNSFTHSMLSRNIRASTLRTLTAFHSNGVSRNLFTCDNNPSSSSSTAAFTSRSQRVTFSGFAPNNVECKRHSSSSLYSAVEDTTATIEESTSSPGIFVDGTLVNYLPSNSLQSNGNGGLAAIVIKDEMTSTPTEAAQALADTEGSPSSLTETLFAKIPSLQHQQPQNPSQASGKIGQGEDLLGKRVTFSNPNDDGNIREGFVIAQRYPIAYVFVKKTSNDDDSNDEFMRSSAGEESCNVMIHKETENICPSEDWIGKCVDCFGNEISISEDGSVEPVSEGSVADGASNNDDDDEEEGGHRAIFASIPKISDIALINHPLLTGVSMVDALAPIGRGQNMLVVGANGTGKRQLVTDAIQTQTRQLGNRGARCVYACTSPDPETRSKILSNLRTAGVLDNITVVSMSTSATAAAAENEDEKAKQNAIIAAEAVTVASTACSIAEYWSLADGEDCFVVVDNIDLHKSLWDYTTRTLVDIYGMDAVVADDTNGGASSEMRAFYSGLVQRAGKWNKKNGGGSVSLALLVTLLSEDDDGKVASTGGDDDITFNADDFAGFNPNVQARIKVLEEKDIKITPEILQKLQIPTPPTKASVEERLRMSTLRHVDDLVSMSDGQIWLSEELFRNGQRPAMDPQMSITRIGIGADTNCRADAPALRELVGGLRFEFAQAAALEGATDSATNKQILRQSAWLLAMHQTGGDGQSLSEECVTLMAAKLGCLDDVVKAGNRAGTSEGEKTLRDLVQHVKSAVPEVMKEIDETVDMTVSDRMRLEEAVRGFFSTTD
mmetsp:Transcript_35653/g.52296  ORF Transcript_35653/g.52296 Transcript_35653/m.52296 type:complete len:807 (+) Transcript_35653:334-2754(+)|eukprot:CAMPEP_0195528436 /NCGR_PEP_ID=MMETSP0794_2-20130614/30578_1 /TAXON_ID=515487 /ORGANISM="Stephanopyxis turris, Strain CCMP 815" /LENGTH=806 /DNA_ID=CAMNT_0040659575 /DNA_START=330 /DNA_END=2750 /DNA_ORIENTATION=-